MKRTAHGSGNPIRGDGSTLGRYFREIRRYPLLSREEETELGRQAQGGSREAVDRLVESNLRFVVKIAKEYRHRGVPFEDLVSEGNLGLIEAARRYDPGRGTKFSNWAVWSIRKAILMALTEQMSVVRLPASQVSRMQEVRGAERSLRGTLGRDPEAEELAERLPKKLAALDPIHRHGLRFSSLDERVAEDSDLTLDEALEDQGRPSVEHRLLEIEAIATARESYEELDGPLKTVIAHRLGLDGNAPLTLSDLGRRIGMTHEGVRKIECRAKDRLRKLYRRKVYAEPRRPATPTRHPLPRTA